MARFEAPVMNTNRVAPADSASSTAYWIRGLSTTGSISLGLALVAGRKRVPRPATGNTAVRMVDLECVLIGLLSRGPSRELVILTAWTAAKYMPAHKCLAPYGCGPRSFALPM